MTNDQRTRAIERQAVATDRAPHDVPEILHRWLWRQGQRRSGERSCQGCGGEGKITYALAFAVAKKHGHSVPPCPDCNGTGRAPLAWGIELAAYVGHPASREVEGGWGDDCGCDGSEWDHPNSVHTDCLGLTDWIRGLETYGQQAMLRAAVAAQREAVRSLLGSGGSWQSLRCHHASRRLDEVDAWIEGGPKPSWLRGGDPDCAAAVASAAREAGEQAVRDAIRAALVPWALGVE